MKRWNKNSGSLNHHPTIFHSNPHNPGYRCIIERLSQCTHLIRPGPCPVGNFLCPPTRLLQLLTLHSGAGVHPDWGIGNGETVLEWRKYRVYYGIRRFKEDDEIELFSVFWVSTPAYSKVHSRVLLLTARQYHSICKLGHFPCNT